MPVGSRQGSCILSSFLRWRPRREVLHHCLVHPHVNVKEYLENDPEAYTAKDEFLKPLTLIYNSLLDCGDTYIAHGRILDVIRQVQFEGSRNSEARRSSLQVQQLWSLPLVDPLSGATPRSRSVLTLRFRPGPCR